MCFERSEEEEGEDEEDEEDNVEVEVEVEDVDEVEEDVDSSDDDEDEDDRRTIERDGLRRRRGLLSRRLRLEYRERCGDSERR